MDGDDGWRIVVMVAVAMVPMLIGMTIERERERESYRFAAGKCGINNKMTPLSHAAICCGCNAQTCVRLTHVVNFRWDSYWRKFHWKNIHLHLDLHTAIPFPC